MGGDQTRVCKINIHVYFIAVIVHPLPTEWRRLLVRRVGGVHHCSLWRRGGGMDCSIGVRRSHWLTAVVHGLGFHLLTNVVDGLLVRHCRHCQMHCHHRGGVRGGGRGLWPYCLGGYALLMLWWWGSSGRQREDHLVEAHQQAVQRRLDTHPQGRIRR